ncbi:hypothetical protein MICRO8M_80399 [Microbacterium sp. 8M]|nr:hypothetical protein MICRO8M_80399 [Microbacterium sp. 8M]
MLDLSGHGVAGERLPAPQTQHGAHRAVQFDHARGPGSEMQPVDVLRDHTDGSCVGLEGGDRAVTGVRIGGAEGTPSEMTAEPVPALRVLGSEERLHGHGGASRCGTGAAIGGDAGIRGETGTGEEGDAAAGQQFGDRLELRVQRRHAAVHGTSPPESTVACRRGGHGFASAGDATGYRPGRVDPCTNSASTTPVILVSTTSGV